MTEAAPSLADLADPPGSEGGGGLTGLSTASPTSASLAELGSPAVAGGEGGGPDAAPSSQGLPMVELVVLASGGPSGDGSSTSGSEETALLAREVAGDADPAPAVASLAESAVGAPAPSAEVDAASATSSTTAGESSEAGETTEPIHEDLLQVGESTEPSRPRVGPGSQGVGPSCLGDATVGTPRHQHETHQEKNTMSECNCGGKGCATCCVDCNTGWIQADLREGNSNFRTRELQTAADFRTSETNACNNAQGAIRDRDLLKSQLAGIMDRGFTAGALADCNTQQAVHHEGSTTRLEAAHIELRQQAVAAANAAVAAAAACRTDQLVQNTAAQTQKDLATGFCDLKMQLAQCCCDIQKLVTAEGVQTRSFVQNIHVEDLQRRLAQCESATASYFARGVPPTIPTC